MKTDVHSIAEPPGFLYERLAASLTRLIDLGTLQPGDRLPALRRISKQEGVSLSTALQAYRLLEDRRLVEARPQSGFYVRPRVRQRPVEPPVSTPPADAMDVHVTDLVLSVFEAAADPQALPLGAAIPSPDLLPTARLNRLLGQVARRHAVTSSQYLVTQGYEPLRQAIARLAFDWGCTLAADDVVITSGCMEALALCLQTVARAGDTVAVESPTYFGVLQLIESLEMKALELPTHPRDGVRLDALEAAVRRGQIRACLLAPSFLNPLGSRMPETARQHLVELLAAHEVPLIEDDLYGDLYFEPPRPKSLKAYDRTGLVMTCGSFSKTLAPGYRIGWALPGRYKTEVIRRKLATTISSAAPQQLALASFLQNGSYARHLRTLRRAFQSNLERMTNAIGAYFPAGTRVTRPQGGFVLWVELPEPVDALVLHRAALNQHISIAPGPIFSATGAYGRCIRLSAGYPWTPHIDEALHTLGHLAAQQLRE